MYRYITLENVTNELLYDTFLEAFQGFPIVSQADIKDFNHLLENNEYDPTISVGAFCANNNELVAFVLNSMKNAENTQAAYIILTGTKPSYRRQGIMSNIFGEAKKILRQKKAVWYYTEVLANNASALYFYQEQGFQIKNEVTTDVSLIKGKKQVFQYEIAMIL